MKTTKVFLFCASFFVMLFMLPSVQTAAAQDFWGYSSQQPDVPPSYSDTTGTYDSTDEGGYTINNYYYGYDPYAYGYGYGYGWYPGHWGLSIGFGVGFGYAYDPWWYYGGYPGWGGWYSPYYYPGYYGGVVGYVPGYWHRYGRGGYGYGYGGVRTIGSSRGFGNPNGNLVGVPGNRGTVINGSQGTGSNQTPPAGRTIGATRGTAGTNNGNLVGTSQQNQTNANQARQARGQNIGRAATGFTSNMGATQGGAKAPNNQAAV